MRPPPSCSSLRNLKPEEREQRTKGLFEEFVASNDAAEALQCCRELVVEGFAVTLVKLGVDKVLDCTKEKEQVTREARGREGRYLVGVAARCLLCS